jgi:hypothetical protein
MLAVAPSLPMADRHSLKAHDGLRDLIMFLAKFRKHFPNVHRVRIAQRRNNQP